MLASDHPARVSFPCSSSACLPRPCRSGAEPIDYNRQVKPSSKAERCYACHMRGPSTPGQPPAGHRRLDPPWG